MKNKFKLLLLIMLVAGISSGLEGCSETKKQKPLEINNALTEEEKQNGLLTPEVMWKMGRVGNSAVSPDGSQVAYTVTEYNMAENRGVSNLYIISTEGGESTQLTDNAGSEFNVQWSADGKKIYFLSTRGGAAQIWTINPDGSGLKKISNIKDGIEGFGVAPSGDKVFYVQSVHVEARKSSDIYADADKSKALVYDDIMARHWDYWDEGSYLHIFVADITKGKVGAGIDIMQGEPWDAPMAPYFDTAEITWNNAGTQLAYTCKKLTGKEYALSTDSDIYVYDLATKETLNINKGNKPVNPRTKIAPAMPGYDKYPVFSPDDKKIAFTSMARPGNEADKERLFVWDSESGAMTNLTANFDYNAMNVIWTDNDNITFIAPMEGTLQVCAVNTSGSSAVSVLSSGDHDINHISISNNGVCIAEMTTQRSATELYRFENNELHQITFVNKNIYDNIKMGDVQKRWVRTTDGRQMLTWVVLPPDFDPAKKYPTLLFCQGGPQSIVSQFWSYRWNFQLMAAQGYIVVAPNRRGVPSFGQEWTDQISGDYSGQNIRDLLSAIDDVAREPWSDENRLGCVGASYGGYSSFFLAGNHQKRFKAFIAHCGMYDFDSMYGATEELFFVTNDLGGPYWDKNNKTAQRSFANSPHRFAQKWDTPILIITGLKDYRIPYTQSLEAFTAARVQGIPSRLVAFEDEAHQVFKPQNSLVWNREFFGWLDKYLE